MRIAHVSTERSWGGGEQQARLLVEGLAERGHVALSLARRGGEFARRMSADGFAVGTFGGSGRSPLAAWQIRRQLSVFRADVVHFHDAHALSGAGVAACGLPAVRVASRKVVFPIRRAWRYARLCERVVCVSQAVRDCCLAAGLSAEHLRVVYDGVDPRRIAAGNRTRGRASLGIGAEVPLLLSIGSLSETKGHRCLIDSLPAVLRRHPRVRLAIAGDGELRGPLEKRIAELGLGQSVQLLGYRSDIGDLLAAADLFVLPSLDEGLCSTLIDAMLARCPIVATRVGGVPELLSGDAVAAPSGEALFEAADSAAAATLASLVPARDTGALANAVCRALDCLPQLGPQLERAYRRACERFTAAQMVEGTLAVYDELLAARRPA